MQNALASFIAWAAQIASTIIITILTAQIKARQDEAERKHDEARAETDAKRRAEVEWREHVEDRLDSQDDKIAAVLKGQTTQMRSDIVHRCHRYIDDLGCAGVEEKDAFWEEYEDYCEICRHHGIKNNFVDQLAQKVMNLPDRPSD